MKVRIGSKVIYRPGFGMDEPVEVTIDGIEICDSYSKQGREVKSAELDRAVGRVVLDMNNGHWAYGDQVDEVVEY